MTLLFRRLVTNRLETKTDKAYRLPPHAYRLSPTAYRPSHVACRPSPIGYGPSPISHSLSPIAYPGRANFWFLRNLLFCLYRARILNVPPPCIYMYYICMCIHNILCTYISNYLYVTKSRTQIHMQMAQHAKQAY